MHLVPIEVALLIPLQNSALLSYRRQLVSSLAKAPEEERQAITDKIAQLDARLGSALNLVAPTGAGS